MKKQCAIAKGHFSQHFDAFETLTDQLESVPRASANKFIQAQRDVLAKQIADAEAKPAPRHTERGLRWYVPT